MNKFERLFTDKIIWLLLILAAILFAFLLYTVSETKTEPSKHSATQDSITRYCPDITKGQKISIAGDCRKVPLLYTDVIYKTQSSDTRRIDL